MIRDKTMFNCSICKFDCSSKEDMFDHLNSQAHIDNTEGYSFGSKNKMDKNLFVKNRNVQEETDCDMLISTKHQEYFGSCEIMSDSSKTSKGSDVHVNELISDEVINIYDDEATKISVPRTTLRNDGRFSGIYDGFQTKEKTATITDNFNLTRSLLKKSASKKVSRFQTLRDKDNETQNNPSSNLNTVRSESTVEEVPITNFEQSTSNITLPSQSNNCMQRDKSSKFFKEHSNGTRETKVDEEFFNNKYKSFTTTDLIISMSKVYDDLGRKKNELFKLQKDIRKYDGEFRYLYKKISENYQKNI
uniref:C2H2-type domain-containing protein n=1 Tax=Strongyloides venezuelensis TaxID=75913 RepID=A0A0K0FEM4_STRVS